MVVSGNGLISGGCLTNGRNSNLEKQVSAHEFSLETNRHPRRAFIFLATNGLSIGSLSNKQNAPGRNYFTPMEGGHQWKSQARLSSYQWSGGGNSYLLIQIVFYS
jgi:hypothetical protein